jgi:hypothetical protein
MEKKNHRKEIIVALEFALGISWGTIAFIELSPFVMSFFKALASFNSTYIGSIVNMFVFFGIIGITSWVVYSLFGYSQEV